MNACKYHTVHNLVSFQISLFLWCVSGPNTGPCDLIFDVLFTGLGEDFLRFLLHRFALGLSQVPPAGKFHQELWTSRRIYRQRSTGA
jgi:hypothetical protein